MTRQNNLIQSSYCQCLYDCDKSTIDGSTLYLINIRLVEINTLPIPI